MKKLILFWCFLLSVHILYAAIVTKENAERIAVDFFNKNYKNKTRSVLHLEMVYDGVPPESRLSEVPAFYVFNNNNGKGFVIVAGDDSIDNILGYSFNNNFDIAELPENLKHWLSQWQYAVTQIRAKDTKRIVSRSQNLNVGEVVVQLETARWDQHYPYNDICPIIDGKKAVTGCVPTAMAIVMRYHKWPHKGNGTLPSYRRNDLVLEERPLGHVYNWDDMLLEYGNDYTQKQIDAVATLMFDCGMACQVSYGARGTGGDTRNVLRALVKYMGYDKSGRFLYRKVVDDEEWYTTIKKELDEGRPMVYDGDATNSAHAFVVDGYTTNNYFSVNWGWSGSGNGFYLLSDMMGFNINQKTIINIKPDEGGIEELGSIRLVGKGLEYEKMDVLINQQFNLKVNLIFLGMQFNGLMSLQLVNKEGIMKEILYETSFSSSLGSTTQLGLNLMIKSKIDVGDKIRCFYKNVGENEWKRVIGSSNCNNEVFVADEYTIEESTMIKFNKKARILTLQLKDDVEVQFYTADGRNLSSILQIEDNMVKIETSELRGKYILKLVKKQYNELKILNLSF